MATDIVQQTSNENAAPLHQQIIAQTRVELLLTLRRGESVLITLVVPVVLLVFFASLNIIPATTGKAVDFLLPGILALAVMAAGMVSLGIATAYERYYGVLKRLGSSPLPRSGLIIAKVISVLVLEFIQVLILISVSVIFYGWRPAGSPPLTLLVLAIGTVTFSALGLAMAGALRAEATLAGANGLYLLFLLLGGGILPFKSPSTNSGSNRRNPTCRCAYASSSSNNVYPCTIPVECFSYISDLDYCYSPGSDEDIQMGVTFVQAVTHFHCSAHVKSMIAIVPFRSSELTINWGMLGFWSRPC